MSESMHPAISGIPRTSRAAGRITPREGGRAYELGKHLYRLPSLVVSWIVANLGAVLLAAAMIGLGFFVTKVLLASSAIAGGDEWFPVWLGHHRTPTLTHWSYIGSMLGDAPVLVPLVGAIALVLVIRRRWRLASFVVQAGLAEGLAYLLATTFVHRQRPGVAHLDSYALNHSFPSGHVAAATAVYGAVAYLLTGHVRQLWAQIAIWTVAVALPVLVALSRMYRGEHHPIDVAAGFLMGVGALLVALFAARTAREAGEVRALRRLTKAAP